MISVIQMIRTYPSPAIVSMQVFPAWRRDEDVICGAGRVEVKVETCPRRVLLHSSHTFFSTFLGRLFVGASSFVISYGDQANVDRLSGCIFERRTESS